MTAFAAGPLEGRAEVTDSYGDTVVDVAPGDWIELLTHVRDALGYAFFDWLTGVDEPPDAFHVVAHVYNPDTRSRLLLRTAVPRDDPRLPTAVGYHVDLAGDGAAGPTALAVQYSECERIKVLTEARLASGTLN